MNTDQVAVITIELSDGTIGKLVVEDETAREIAGLIYGSIGVQMDLGQAPGVVGVEIGP